ncbi:MAG: alpha/beta fold hydrolase [Clostridia bacterium]|nr:alpha/beta fold hydrolase [Clostridia bacterium]
MEKKEFTVISEYDGLKLQGVFYEPKNPKGVVILVHGMCEYKERYNEFMQFLCANGYTAVCYDQRGHGDSVENEEDLGWFRDNDGKAIVDDLADVTRYVKEQMPNLSVTLFGHSMGSMVVRCFLREYDDLIDKLIVCGSPSKNPLTNAGILLAKTVTLFYGDRHRSKLLAFLSTGKGDKNFPGEGKGAWLSRNYKCTADFYSNPKGGKRFTCNGFENLFKLMKRTYQKRGYKVKNPQLPIYFISGDKDAVLGSPRQWIRSQDFLIDVGYENVASKLYEGFRHELLNEVGKRQVYNDVLSFIQSKE